MQPGKHLRPPNCHYSSEKTFYMMQRTITTCYATLPPDRLWRQIGTMLPPIHVACSCSENGTISQL